MASSGPFEYPSDPIEYPDGTLRCGQHGLEICPFCTVDYSFHREMREEEEEDAHSDSEASRQRKIKELVEQQGRESGFVVRCISGCVKTPHLTCSSCKIQMYCSAQHQKADWRKNHKAACAQLVKQLTASSKLRAVFTRSFTILPYSAKKNSPQSAYDELHPLEMYKVVWKKDGKKGEEVFKWRGTESRNHSIPVQPHPFPSPPVASCSLAQRVSMMETSGMDADIEEGGLHALTNIEDQDTFYGMAINFTAYGTILPWAPCYCEFFDSDDDEDVSSFQSSEPKLPKIPGWWKKCRDHWDLIFRRAQVNSLDVDCMFEGSDEGCLAGSICPFKHGASRLLHTGLADTALYA